jgi:hypothetical protein
MLVQAIVGEVSRLSLPSFKLMGAYQHQSIGVRVHLGVLCDVPIWHPWAHGAEGELCLRNTGDREYIRVGNGLAQTTEGLV